MWHILLKSSIFLLLASVAQAAYQPLGDNGVDTAEEVDNINRSFNDLFTSKLDIRPKNVIPLTDSFYTLGDANHYWKWLYVDSITVTGISVSSLTVSSATITKLNSPIVRYNKPSLVYISATTVDISTNSGTANETCVLFGDGDYRCVTENTASASKYRRFIITETGEFTSGTENSGLRSTYVEATNTWYVLYAVKSRIDATKFVIIGDTVTPIVTNYSSLDSTYGSNSWIPIGTIRNGNNSGTTGDIVGFNQSGNFTLFRLLRTSGNSVEQTVGTLLATGSGAQATWVYSAGTGTTAIPGNITIGIVAFGSNANSALIEDSTGQRLQRAFNSGGSVSLNSFPVTLLDGLITNSTAGASNDITLTGFYDGAW